MLLNSGCGDDGRKEGAVELTHVSEVTLVNSSNYLHEFRDGVHELTL
jgi:hypothetical protein